MLKKLMLVAACTLALVGCASSGKIERNAVTCALLGKAAATAVAKSNGDVTSEQAKESLKLALVTALITPQDGAAVPVEGDVAAQQAFINTLLASAILTEAVTPADVGNAVYVACMTK